MLKRQREDRKLAGKRWERLEGGGKAIAEEKRLCVWSHSSPLLGPLSRKGGPGPGQVVCIQRQLLPPALGRGGAPAASGEGGLLPLLTSIVLR